MIDPQRILEDLTGSFAGELRFDPLSRAMYASDASLYEITPLGVAYPRSRDDVVALSRYCYEQGIPLTNKDGSEVSKSKRKDMKKKYDAQVKLHQEFQKLQLE